MGKRQRPTEASCRHWEKRAVDIDSPSKIIKGLGKVPFKCTSTLRTGLSLAYTSKACPVSGIFSGLTCTVYWYRYVHVSCMYKEASWKWHSTALIDVRVLYPLH